MGRITGYLAEENEVSYTYDENGNVLTVSDRNGTITRTYDALNRVTSYTDTFGNIIQYRYDAVGNLEYLIYPDGSEVYYCYDVNNNLVSVTDWAGRVTTYTYDENTRVIGVTKPDGSVTTTVYDNKQRVVSTVEKLPDDTIISGFEYEYDEIGRISTEKVLAKNQKMCYTYDEQSRVVKRTVISLSGTTETEEAFSYDGAGNVTVDNSRTFIYDTNNRLMQYNGNAVTYDEDGNMLSATLNGEETAFSFDSGNRLVSAGGHVYTYNAENVRIRNLCADADTTYIYNTNCKLSQLLMKTTNGITTKYVYGFGLIGEEKCGEFKTYHFDFRGSTVAITDANGTITDTFAYDTYGKLISRTGPSFVIFGYNGRDGVVTDKNGLIYMRARYYSPELRRFVNADIVAGEISNAVTLNRFSYANGNPVSFVDPFGLSASDERGNNPPSEKTWYEFVWEVYRDGFWGDSFKLLTNFVNAFKYEFGIGAGIGGGFSLGSLIGIDLGMKDNYLHIILHKGELSAGHLQSEGISADIASFFSFGVRETYFHKYGVDNCDPFVDISDCSNAEVLDDMDVAEVIFDPELVGVSAYWGIGLSAGISFDLEYFLEENSKIDWGL